MATTTRVSWGGPARSRLLSTGNLSFKSGKAAIAPRPFPHIASLMRATEHGEFIPSTVARMSEAKSGGGLHCPAPVPAYRFAHAGYRARGVYPSTVARMSEAKSGGGLHCPAPVPAYRFAH